MRKKTGKLLILSSLLLSVNLQAQESVNGSGGEGSGSGGAVSYSVGQVVYETYNDSSYSVAQGVQQPYEISVVTGVTSHVGNISCKVYPNPSTSYLHLQVEKLEEGLTYALYTMDGKLLENSKVIDNLTSVSMGNYVPSTYLLVVKLAERTIQTFEIIKN